ncbi:hypothetical protein C8R48DRAFT_707510 [Suillus tomentosus]|nr:hypothetical protein C8R48DRAFT_707510 [Suillus tomentosus]
MRCDMDGISEINTKGDGRKTVCFLYPEYYSVQTKIWMSMPVPARVIHPSQPVTRSTQPARYPQVPPGRVPGHPLPMSGPTDPNSDIFSEVRIPATNYLLRVVSLITLHQ